MGKRKNNKITFRLTIDLDTLEQVINILEGKCDKNFINKLRRAYNRRKKYQVESDKRVTKILMPKYSKN